MGDRCVDQKLEYHRFAKIIIEKEMPVFHKVRLGAGTGRRRPGDER